jgi:hypothetical protein
VTTPVTNAAIPATIMALVGSPDAAKFPGPPLSAFWTEPETASKWPNPLSELAQNEFINTNDKVVVGKIPTAADGNMASLITPRWHLIAHERLGAQLYDWTVDPGELKNLIDTPEGRAVAVSLNSELKRELTGRIGISQKSFTGFQ